MEKPGLVKVKRVVGNKRVQTGEHVGPFWQSSVRAPPRLDNCLHTFTADQSRCRLFNGVDGLAVQAAGGRAACGYNVTILAHALSIPQADGVAPSTLFCGGAELAALQRATLTAAGWIV